MTGLAVRRQCALCQAVLPTDWRPPLCPTCRLAYQQERNRANVRAYRERRRAAAATYLPGLRADGPVAPETPDTPSEDETHSPTESDLTWLAGLNVGLAQPVRQALNLLSTGRDVQDPQVLELARWIVARYDLMRPMFDERARLWPDPENRAEAWRGFFESVRRLVV